MIVWGSRSIQVNSAGKGINDGVIGAAQISSCDSWKWKLEMCYPAFLTFSRFVSVHSGRTLDLTVVEPGRWACVMFEVATRERKLSHAQLRVLPLMYLTHELASGYMVCMLTASISRLMPKGKRISEGTSRWV